MPDPNEYLGDFVMGNEPLGPKAEHEKAEVLKIVVKWKKEYNVEDLTYASSELKKTENSFGG